jgi:hypothetical protein
MTDIRSLERTLLDNLPWNKARIKFVARFLLALYAVQTVNLSILATAFSGQAKEESNYKRLQRFAARIRDALCRTCAVYREVAWRSWALHPGAGSDKLESWRRRPKHPDAFDCLSRRLDSSCLDCFVQSGQFRHQRTDDGDRNLP